MSYDDVLVSPWVEKIKETLGAESLIVCYVKKGEVCLELIESDKEDELSPMELAMACVHSLHLRELDILEEFYENREDDGAEG